MIMRAKSRLLVALMQQLASVVETIAAYDQEITRLFLTHPDSGIFVLAGDGNSPSSSAVGRMGR